MIFEKKLSKIFLQLSSEWKNIIVLSKKVRKNTCSNMFHFPLFFYANFSSIKINECNFFLLLLLLIPKFGPTVCIEWGKIQMCIANPWLNHRRGWAERFGSLAKPPNRPQIEVRSVLLGLWPNLKWVGPPKHTEKKRSGQEGFVWPNLVTLVAD